MNPAQYDGGSAATFQQVFVHRVQNSMAEWLAAAVEKATEDLEAPSKRQRISADFQHIGAMLVVLRQQRGELLRGVIDALQPRVGAHWRAPQRVESTEAAPEAGPGMLRLSLISEAQIDDEIETARIVQLIESEAEIQLQELAALCSGMLGRPVVEPGVVPLLPADCARALREGVAQLTPEAGLRAALLRTLGQAVGAQMRAVYAAQVGWLQQAGIAPAAFRIHATPSGDAGPNETMRTLVGRARRAAPQPAVQPAVQAPPASERPPEDTEPPSVELRLFDTPLQYGADEGPLPRAASERLMHGLFTELRRQSGSTPALGQFLRRVENVAQRAATADPAVWNDPDHPWWRLLDRLLATGVMHDDLQPGDQGVLQQALHAVVQQVETAPRLDSVACQRAADELSSRTSLLMEAAAAPSAAEVNELRRLAEREELEASFRQQIVQQLRSTPTSAEMRRFLVGPWTLTLVALAQQHGTDSQEVAQAALVVDDLILATSQPGQRVSKAQRHVLLRQVGSGLASAALAAPRVDAELVELAALLRDPPPHPEPAENPDVAQGPARTEALAGLTEPAPLDLHGRLPTVPMALGPGGSEEQGPPTGRATAADWLATLQPGAACRLFLQGQWMTTRLHWVGPGQRLFLFNSRHGGRSHSLTERMLLKLRDAGLATSIDDSLLRTQALDSMMQSTLF